MILINILILQKEYRNYKNETKSKEKYKNRDHSRQIDPDIQLTNKKYKILSKSVNSNLIQITNHKLSVSIRRNKMV